MVDNYKWFKLTIKQIIVELLKLVKVILHIDNAVVIRDIDNAKILSLTLIHNCSVD